MAEDELTFTVNGMNFDLELTFAGNATSGTVIAISGTAGSNQVTGLDSSYQGPDNTISLGYPFVDYNGLSFDIAGDQFNLYDLNGAPDIIDQEFFGGGGAAVTNLVLDVPCYLRGTRIQAERGRIAVENLVIGERVLTGAGIMRPIKWIGHRTYGARFANNHPDFLPICFKANSIADGVPVRDLFVSPEHAMYLDGVLVPARHLVNGISVVQVPKVGELGYYHVELESHDVLLAEGAEAESFLDDGSRARFQNSHEYQQCYGNSVEPVQKFCAPRIDSGEALARIRQSLASRAHAVLQMAPELRSAVG